MFANAGIAFVVVQTASGWQGTRYGKLLPDLVKI
jgi:hypothetical protein